MWGRLLDALERSWRILTRPSVYFSLGFLTIGGFVAGVIFWGAFNTAMELTNTEAFCTGCHEMRDNVYPELAQTVHFSNRSGVRATCSGCHVPHNWTDKIARKMQASKEVWGKIFGTINTREKFLDHRLELAAHVRELVSDAFVAVDAGLFRGEQEALVRDGGARRLLGDVH